MRSDLPSGTVTFLFTDVEGSTKLLHELGADAYDQALIEHRRVLREAFVRHGGVEVDAQGDAFFYVFPKADEALTAAGEGTAALEEGPIAVRLGLHTGTPHIGKEGYIGEDVHLAARMAASAHGGQVILSAATAELVELELTDLGEHRLKDIAHSVSIFQLGNGSFPPLKTISNTNLPTPASSFIGRDDELLEVLSRFEEGARLVMLTGPGGTGKTRLAIEAAATLISEYKAGVFWVGLATLRDPALVMDTIAQTLGAKDGLTDHIANREMLLLLDNLEQVIDCAPELSELLTVCPNLDVLVTSRELLRIQGEVEYAVPPLAESEAVSLFCDRSQLAPDETIAELCKRVDNLPLAVELAASRTSVLTPGQILERLSQRLDLLKGGRDADPRQQTLRTTIEWSYDLLAEDERQLFARLSVFAGGCTLEAVEEVAGGEIDTLESLVEKSLVRFTNERYWMLETIRAFAGDRLLHSSDEAAYLERHATYFTDLVLEADASLREGRDQKFWWSTLQVDYANIRTSLEHLQHRDRRHLLECATALRVFWRTRGYLAEGRLWLERGLEADDPVPAVRSRALDGLAHIASAQGDLEGAARYVEEALRIARSAGDVLVVSMLLSNLARISADRFELDRALALQYEAVDLARGLEDKRPLEMAVGNLGYVMLVGGDAAGAIPVIEEALSISREVGDVSGQSTALLNLGSAQLRVGGLDASRRAFLEAMEKAASVGWDEWVAYALQGVAATIVDSDPRRAAELLGASGRLLDEAGVEMEPNERRIRETALDRVAVLLEDAAPDALASGAVLETDAAVELATASGESDST